LSRNQGHFRVIQDQLFFKDNPGIPGAVRTLTSVQTFWVCILLPAVIPPKLPDRGRAILNSRQQNLVKKNDLILNGGIFTNILMQQDNVKYL
jgi:hypothetical protein